MQLVTATKGKLPSSYSKAEEANSDHVHGQAIISELNNLHTIVAHYLSFLNKQDGHNLEARVKEAGHTSRALQTGEESQGKRGHNLHPKRLTERGREHA